MAVGVDEDARVAAPEGRRAGSGDRRTRALRLRDDGVHLLLRARVVGERDAAPAARVLDAAVLGELIATSERDDHPARLEEDDVIGGRGAGRPTERLVEGAGALKVRDAERNAREPLLLA